MPRIIFLSDDEYLKLSCILSEYDMGFYGEISDCLRDLVRAWHFSDDSKYIFPLDISSSEYKILHDALLRAKALADSKGRFSIDYL